MKLMSTTFLIALLLLLICGAIWAAPVNHLKPREDLTDTLVRASSDMPKNTLLLKLGGDLANLRKDNPGNDTALTSARRALGLALQLKNQSRAGDCYEQIADIYKKRGDLTLARNLQKAAITCFQQANDMMKLGDVYRKLGHTYDYQIGLELAERIKCDSLGLICYEKTNQRLKQGFTLESLGDLNHIRNEIPLAIASLKRALIVFKSINHPDVQGVLFYLTTCYEQIGDLKQALTYGLSSIRVAEALKDSSDMPARMYNYVGKIYKKVGQSEKAIAYYRLGIEFEHRYRQTNSLLILTANLAHILILQGRPLEALDVIKQRNAKDPEDQYVTAGLYLCAYTSLKQYHQADKYYQEVLKLNAVMDKLSTAKIFIAPIVIRYLFDSKNFKEARLAVDEFGENYRGNHNNQGIVIRHHWLFRLDSAEGNYVSAIKHIQAEQLIRDSLINDTKMKSISQLEVQYETEKKEQHIQLLIKQSQLQKAGLQRASLIRNVVIAGAVMLIVLLLLSYNRYQIKQRSNIKLQEQQAVINHKNKSLERLVSDKDLLLLEKEWLLKEIHHRVKNNLQIVISLLNSQSGYLDNEAALDAIRESQHRMHSISLIHQKLYQSDNLAQIDMIDYIVELTGYLQDSFDTGKSVLIDLQIEPISLDVALAVPLGLILNEAITNAMKYAFKPGSTGTITIGLDEPDVDSILLTISDDGPGLSKTFDIDQCSSLGMSLMKGLSQQLHGELKLINDAGLTIQLLIPTKVPVTEEGYIAV